MTSIPENTPGKKKLGRPSRAEKFGGHIATAEQRIADNLPELIDNLFDLARGVTVREEGQHGPRVYTRAPDRQANEYLINRIMGKPTENPTPPPDPDDLDDTTPCDEDGNPINA